jgi:hypothetical protein
LIYAPFPYGPLCWEEGHRIDEFLHGPIRQLHLHASVGTATLGLLVLRLPLRLHALGLVDAITFVLLFLLAVCLLGLLVGLVHMLWRARQDRREQEREDEVSPRRSGALLRAAVSAELLAGLARA